jgi:hypothetical protein
MKIIYALVVIIIIILIVWALLPKDFKLTSEVVINAPKDKVRNYIKSFTNQKNYSVRVMTDPNVKLTYSWVDGMIWSIQTRDSLLKNVGKWEQEITAIDQWKSMDVTIRFERPMQATNYAKNSLEEIWNNQTKVTTIFYGTNPRPQNIMSYFFLPQVQKDMDTNNANLKKELEK